MFILTKISDLIKIPASDLGKSPGEAIEDCINEKYANRVIHKIGLCICFYDLLGCTEGLLGHNTGITNVNVEFRMVVFRPFKGEVITGKISSSTEHGVNVRTDFFESIFVPGHLLFEGSRFSPTEALWIWETEGQELYFDKNEAVRVRVEAETFNDLVPLAPNERQEQGVMDRKSPYEIQASMTQGGLGPCIWWDED